MSQGDEEGRERMEKEAKESSSENNKQDMTKKIYGDYEILKAIGKGKFAVVYRAKRKSDDEIVALKRISVDTVDNKTREKCLKEVKLLQSLDHPNIIKYLDSFINDNDLVIVFEWAAAGDLKRQLRKAQEKDTPFEERIIWKYFSQIANAIQHMHERRIMHRDLKPANIFLTLDGTVKLGDLGLSRELSENTIQAHSKVGTPLYMSPEVLRGDGYDFKSDIWSIGCLLYELAMLKSPFKSEGLNLYSLFQKIGKGDYQPLPERYSEELRTLAYSMISTNSEDRPEIAYICDVSSRMRTKFNEEHIRQRRASKQKEKEDSEPVDNESDTPEKADDKSVNSNASSKTQRRQNPNHRHREVKQRDDASSHSAQDKNDRKSLDSSDRSESKDNSKKVKPAETSLPSCSKTPEVVTNKNQYDDLMNNLKGDEYQIHADYRGISPNGRNRFNDQNLGNSFSNECNDNGKHKTPEKKSKMDSSQSSSNESVSLPRTNATQKSNGSLFNDNKSTPRKDETDYRHSQYKASTNGHGYIPQSKNDNVYSVPLADQNAFTTKKTEIKVERRKKSFGEDKQMTEKRKSHNLRSEEPPGRRESDGDLLGVASPLGKNDAKSSFIMSSVASAQMELLYGKLVLLEYPIFICDAEGAQKMTCRITPFHFAGDLNIILGQRAQNFPESQFHTFVHVAEWLIQKANGQVLSATGVSKYSSIDAYNDPPVLIVKQLLKMAEDAGVDSQAIAQLPPTSLSNGHGDISCAFLNLLADVAMQKHSKRKPIVYPSEGFDDAQELHDIEEDDVIEDDVDLEPCNNFEPDETESEGTSRLQMSMIVGGIDSNQWKEETERVASKLSAGKADIYNKKHSSWSSHLQLFQEHSRVVLNCCETDTEDSNITDMLQALQRSLLEGISGIARAESLLNNKEEFLQKTIEYAKIKEELDRLEEKATVGGKNIAKLTDKLAEAQEIAQEMASKLSERTEQTDDSGNSTLLNLKRAMQRIKEESKDMQIRTAIVQQQLMLHLKQQAATARKKHNLKKKKKQMSSTGMFD